MFTGLCFVMFGLLIMFYPEILVILLSSLLILIGIVIMMVSWQFRRFHKHSQSYFVNWITRY